MDYILEVDRLSKSFPKSGFALEEVSFSLPYGSILGFVGENGAGKTTTIGCILNTVTRDSGTVKLFGREMADGDTDLRERIGVVYDGDNFPGYWTAAQLERVMAGLYTHWDGALFHRYLEEFRLPTGQRLSQFSRGMTMKLALAAALSHRPQLLILDEATGGLDPVMREEILDLLLGFVQKEDHAVLLSSHITGDLEKVADTITFLHQGRVILTAPKDELIYHYAVLRCRESQFRALDQGDILAYRRREFQIDVLVADGRAAQRKYRDVVVDPASVEEIMLLLGRGERV